jgi:hypothetical protein
VGELGGDAPAISSLQRGKSPCYGTIVESAKQR